MCASPQQEATEFSGLGSPSVLALAESPGSDLGVGWGEWSQEKGALQDSLRSSQALGKGVGLLVI